MTLPALFQRLVDDEGWEVVADEQRGMDDRYEVRSELLRFSSSIAKDAERHFVVMESGDRRVAWGAMNPRNLAARMGGKTNDELVAFEFVASSPKRAVSELRKFSARRRYLEPILVFPTLPLIIFALIPPIRKSVLRIVAWWTDGPVNRLVY